MILQFLLKIFPGLKVILIYKLKVYNQYKQCLIEKLFQALIKGLHNAHN